MVVYQIGTKWLKPPIQERSCILKQYMGPFLMAKIRGWVLPMLLKACNRCGNLIPYGSPYCMECTPIVEAERETNRLEAKRESDKRYNKTRDPKYTRFYNGIEWRTLSAKYTQDKGYKCECCGGMATQVHHKKAIQTPEGWELRLDYNNLELLCTACHNERHERFKRRRGYYNR